MNEKLSAVILTYNSEDNINRCLQSINWADEIIVIDSFSKDKTLEIVESYKARIFQNEYKGYSKQLEYGINLAKNNWILVLDSDEKLTGELVNEIKLVLQNPQDVGGYEIPRKVFFLGRYIRHGGWYPDYQFRLFKKDKSEPIHLEVHGAYTTTYKKEKLSGEIIHYTYRNLYDYINRMNIYTSLDTDNKLKQNPGRKIKWYNFILNPLSVFFRMFFFKKGYKDGMQGFIIALVSAFYNLVLYVKAWEYQMSAKYKYAKPPITNIELNHFRKRGDND